MRDPTALTSRRRTTPAFRVQSSGSGRCTQLGPRQLDLGDEGGDYRLAPTRTPRIHAPTPFGAQDTNGDGLATIAEGAVDVDFDGLFGDAEAELYGMNCYICWEDVTVCGSQSVSGGYTLRNNHMCVYNRRTLVSWCKVFNYQKCEEYSSSCKAG